jgi:transcription antitermination factor NusG
MTARWYVAQVHPGCEQAVAHELTKQGFVPFAPQFQTRRITRGHEIFTLRQLFPGYQMVSFDIDVQRWKVINSTRGVVKLFMSRKAGDIDPTPIPVPVGVVERLAAQIGDDGYWHEKDDSNTKPWISLAGKQVRVTEGPFTAFTGLCQKSDDGRVRVLLDIFGQKRPIDMPRENVATI